MKEPHRAWGGGVIRDFHHCILKWNWPPVVLIPPFLVWFGNPGYAVLIKRAGVFPLFLFSLQPLGYETDASVLEYWVGLPVKPPESCVPSLFL